MKDIIYYLFTCLALTLLVACKTSTSEYARQNILSLEDKSIINNYTEDCLASDKEFALILDTYEKILKKRAKTYKDLETDDSMYNHSKSINRDKHFIELQIIAYYADKIETHIRFLYSLEEMLSKKRGYVSNRSILYPKDFNLITKIILDKNKLSLKYNTSILKEISDIEKLVFSYYNYAPEQINLLSLILDLKLHVKNLAEVLSENKNKLIYLYSSQIIENAGNKENI